MIAYLGQALLGLIGLTVCALLWVAMYCGLWIAGDILWRLHGREGEDDDRTF